MRNLERELGTLLRKTATRIASGTAEAPVTIDLEAVRDALGRQKHFQESAIRTAVPGCGHRPGGDRSRRRRAVRRGHGDGRQAAG